MCETKQMAKELQKNKGSFDRRNSVVSMCKGWGVAKVYDVQCSMCDVRGILFSLHSLFSFLSTQRKEQGESEGDTNGFPPYWKLVYLHLVYFSINKMPSVWPFALAIGVTWSVWASSKLWLDLLLNHLKWTKDASKVCTYREILFICPSQDNRHGLCVDVNVINFHFTFSIAQNHKMAQAVNKLRPRS